LAVFRTVKVVDQFGDFGACHAPKKEGTHYFGSLLFHLSEIRTQQINEISNIKHIMHVTRVTCQPKKETQIINIS
jgi:hypothetical protein